MGSLCCGLCDPHNDEEYNQRLGNNSKKAYNLKSEHNINENRDTNISESNDRKDLNESDSQKVLNSGQQSNQYRTASREEAAAAAERRAKEQSSRGAKGVVDLKARSAELPDKTTGGLRWQVG